jgi:hypothetical protein
MAMGLMKRMYSKSIFYKVLVFFLMISLPLYVITLSIVWKVSVKMANEAKSAMEEKLYFFSSHLENEIASINQQLLIMDIESDVDDFVRTKNQKDHYNNFLAYNKIHSKLVNVHILNSYISDVYLILEDSEDEISIKNSYQGLSKRKIPEVKNPDKSQELFVFTDDNYINYQIYNRNNYLLGVEINQYSMLN